MRGCLGFSCLGIFFLPSVANAAAPGLAPVDLFSAVPFILLLAAIAVMPLLSGKWWHHNRNKILITAIFTIPTAIYLFGHPGGTTALFHEIEGYLSFVMLLASLYVISAGIVIRGDLEPTPRTNLALLASGAILANFIGTTGASMLLIRPMLRINSNRAHRSHVPLFFIFVVSNTAGLLSPLGDPPLFLGFLQGVDFTWTLNLWPHWLVTNGLIMLIFFCWERKVGCDQCLIGEIRQREKLRIDGLRLSVPLMLGVIFAVLSKKYLPFPIAEIIMFTMTALSLRFTPGHYRKENLFEWTPIAEVAILFAGIFVTMVPALALLNQHGAKVGVKHPWQYFWLTGLLSSILDNAPTYLSIGTMASGGHGLAELVVERPEILAAISCGAVFMGANSYIGNGPNFMVKAIAERSGYKMPSFGRYVLISSAVLLPVFGVVTIVFF